MTHSETPWYIMNGAKHWLYSSQTTAPNTNNEIGTIREYPNAAHIVKCVNAHDELVEALKFYADKNNYIITPAIIDYDCGNKATEVLTKNGLI